MRDGVVPAMSWPQHPPAYPGPSDSPAELLHGMLEVLLAGNGPDLRDVVLLRSLLLQSAPWYAPVNAGEQIRNAHLDVSCRCQHDNCIVTDRLLRVRYLSRPGTCARLDVRRRRDAVLCW